MKKNNNSTVTDKAIEYSLSCKQSDFPQKRITCSRDAADFIKQFYGDDMQIFESVFILLLNRSNITTAYAKISQGGIHSTVVDVKIICKYAVDSLASGIIMAHNHPTGTLQASEPDLKMTEKVKNALKIVDSQLLDHLILTQESYLSMADKGML